MKDSILTSADQLSQRGLDLLAASQPKEAAKTFRAAIDLDFGHVEAHHGLTRALRERFVQHRAIARWTLPLWLYVSITGVVVYWLLYIAYTPILPA